MITEQCTLNTHSCQAFVTDEPDFFSTDDFLKNGSTEHDMTHEEALVALTDWRQDNVKIDHASAHRRRIVLQMDQRRAWKALGYITSDKFVQAKLGGMCKAGHLAIIARAKIEQQIKSKILDFEKENVKDWVLTVLKEYNSADQIKIVRSLMKSRREARQKSSDGHLPAIKGKQIGEVADNLGIVPIKPKPIVEVQNFGLNPQREKCSEGITYTVALTAEERELLWQLKSRLAAERGEDMTPVDAIRILIARSSNGAEEAKLPENENLTRDSYCQVSHEPHFSPMPEPELPVVSVGSEPQAQLSAEFKVFWEAYPSSRRGDKRKTQAEWNKAREGAEFNDIMQGLAKSKQSDQWQEEKFIVHAERFLRGSRWESAETYIPEKSGADVPGKASRDNSLAENAAYFAQRLLDRQQNVRKEAFSPSALITQ